MKPGKRQLGPCTLKLSYSQIVESPLRGGLFEVSHLATAEEHRGKGYATRLMDEVCQEADDNRKVLVIRPDEEWLEEFYERFGFVEIQANPVLMARPPILTADH